MNMICHSFIRSQKLFESYVGRGGTADGHAAVKPALFVHDGELGTLQTIQTQDATFGLRRPWPHENKS